MIFSIRCGRPSRIFPGAASPLSDRVLGGGEVDFVVVREGTEGPYTGNGGALRVGTPHEIATEVSVNTAFGVERVVRDAFRRAQKRRGQLTLVHKTNVLVNAGATILVGGRADDLPGGIELAREAIDSGAAAAVRDRLRAAASARSASLPSE